MEQKWPQEIWLVRHGQSAGNVARDAAEAAAGLLIDIAEREASSELYGGLKRADEKFVTERAYDNPKFVEDMVRDVATQLNNEKRIDAFTVESENFESIHNHSAYALIENDKRKH